MATSVVPTVVTGDTWTAANHNTYIRDNLNELLQYQQAEDLIVGAGAGALKRLAKGANGSYLGINNSGALAYSNITMPKSIHASIMGDISVEKTTTSTSFVDIGLDATLTLTKTCTVFVFAAGSLATGNSSYPTAVRAVVGGTAMANNNALPITYMTQYAPFSLVWMRTGVAAGSQIVKVQLKSGNAGTTAYFSGGYIVAIAFEE